MKKIEQICIFILCNILEIFIDIYKLFANIIYFFVKPKYQYENIISIEYLLFAPPDLENYYIYNKEKVSNPEVNIDNNYFDKVIKTSNIEFEKLVEVLKNNKILNFNRYIHKVAFSSYEDLFYVEDGGTAEQVLKIYFENNKFYRLDINCNNKRFENIMKEINKIVI